MHYSLFHCVLCIGVCIILVRALNCVCNCVLYVWCVHYNSSREGSFAKRGSCRVADNFFA